MYLGEREEKNGLASKMDKLLEKQFYQFGCWTEKYF